MVQPFKYKRTRKMAIQYLIGMSCIVSGVVMVLLGGYILSR